MVEAEVVKEMLLDLAADQEEVRLLIIQVTLLEVLAHQDKVMLEEILMLCHHLIQPVEAVPVQWELMQLLVFQVMGVMEPLHL